MLKKIFVGVFIIVLFIWLGFDIWKQNKHQLEIDENKIEMMGIIENIQPLENTSDITFKYIIDGYTYHGSASEISGLGRIKIGDSLKLEASSKNVHNFRISLENRKK